MQAMSGGAWMGFLGVGVGAAIGAWLRYGLAGWLNPLWPGFPLGTLAANLLGGYLVGVAVAFFSDSSGLHPALRLFLITGFLGGLTTFSSFSAEVVALFMREEWSRALGLAMLHVVGSLSLTAAGVWTVSGWRG
jgi:CrcB protein